MIIRRALESFVLANPGSKLREIAHGCGITDRKAITNAGAQLAQLVNFGRLRAEKPIGQFHGLKYYPNELTGQYKPRPTAEESAAKARAREERKQFKARQRRLTAAQQQAFYSTAPQPPARTASAAPDVLAPPTRPAKPAAVAETVEEFQRRGGRIQRLGAFETSNPLKFDHSHGAALNRPHRRARVAVSP